ncbi:craniofacial development protein 2-like [Clytia hemisphaerica]|uniref:craniofacial development protein 2-like n=1 Tax=Clytia hemisphaerica TaxID=252671 RepID=UPI0034D59F33
MYIRIMIEKSIIRFFSVYAPQTGLPEPEKDKFYNDLLAQTAIIPAEEFLIICGDLNGHVGKDTAGVDNVHGRNGFGDRNADGFRLLDFCLAAGLSVTNTFFSKQELITYQSGPSVSQIDFILIPRNHLKLVRNVTVINGEECTPQHKLIIGDIMLNAGRLIHRTFPRRRRVWKLKDPAFSMKPFVNVLTLNCKMLSLQMILMSLGEY